MKKTLKILRSAWNGGHTDTEVENNLKNIRKDELIDFICWNFNRGKFTSLIITKNEK
jgi:hypothetical protein